MANSLNTNPILLDTTTAASWSGEKSVILFQWVDNNEDIIDGDMCQLTVNGVQLEVEIQVEVTANFGMLGPVVWQIGPFAKGVSWSDFSLDTLDSGAVHIWIE